MTTKDILRLTAMAALALPLLAACGDGSQTTEAPAERPASQAGDTPPATAPTPPAGVAGGGDAAEEPEVGVGGQEPGASPADPSKPVEEAIKETEKAIETVPERQR